MPENLLKQGKYWCDLYDYVQNQYFKIFYQCEKESYHPLP